MKKTGISRKAFLAIGGTVINGNGTVTTTAANWNIILKRGAGGGLPAGTKGLPPEVPLNTPFKSPTSGPQFVLAVGDQIIQFDFERFCKTTASYSLEQGNVDVGDDCTPGATLRDGITKFSGSLAGFFQFDDATEQLSDMSQKIYSLFVPFMEDDGEGNYSYNPPEDPHILLGLCHNGEAAEGKIENWITAPININSINAPGDNSGVQSLDIAFSLGEGEPVFYNVPKTA